jgi:hypothetical protein
LLGKGLSGFSKTKQKLKDIWEAHCVDSHVLCEMALGNITPFKGMYRVNFFKFSKRQLHVQNPLKGGLRKLYGGTRSMGITRGTLVKNAVHGQCYVGGTSKERVSLHSVDTGKRLTQNAKVSDLLILSKLQWRTQFLPALNGEVSLRESR